MDNPNALSEQDLANICSLVLPNCKPGRLFYAGALAGRMSAAARNAGAAITEGAPGGKFPLMVAGWDGADLAGAARAEDSVLFEQDVLALAAKQPADQFIQSFGAPGKIFLLLYPDSGMVLLPSAANSFFRLGYVRDFSIGLWLEEGRGFVCAFTRAVGENDLVEMYEEEWWRTAVLNQKRRRLLQETLHELTQTTHLVIDLEIRWEAFWNSRSGKIVKLIEKVRKFIPF